MKREAVIQAILKGIDKKVENGESLSPETFARATVENIADEILKINILEVKNENNR